MHIIHAESTTATKDAGDEKLAETRNPSIRPSPSSILAWGNTAAGAMLILITGISFVLASGRPLWHTDIWGHLAHGRLIWETGQIPETAQLMPLARGVEVIDTAWLSQIIGYLTIREFGVAGLQALAGACVALSGGALMAIGWRRTGSLLWALLGGAAWLWLEWKQLFAATDVNVIIRPQMAGLLLFILTLAVVVSRPRWWHWLLVPVMFAAWANLHGSFPMGLALFGLYAIGRAADLLRRTDRFGAALIDWPFWRYVLLMEIAAAAALLNPYGLRLYAEVWLFSNEPNLASLIEWEPLTLHMDQGQAAAAITLVLLFLYRMTPRRIQMGEVLALLVLGAMTLWTSRMIVWWAPVAAWCLMVHGAALWGGRNLATAGRPWWRRPNPLWTIAGVLAIGAAIVLSPFGGEQFRGRTVAFEDAVSDRTPLGAARHLGENPPAGLVFNSMELGDFLMWTNPGMPVFAGSHVHLIPRDVWLAYLDISRGQAGWSSLLDRYGVQAVVLDRASKQSFIDRLAEEDGWERTYEDNSSTVFRRVRPEERREIGGD